MRFKFYTALLMSLMFACQGSNKKSNQQPSAGAPAPSTNTIETHHSDDLKIDVARATLVNGPWNANITTDLVTLNGSAYEFKETTVKLTTWCTVISDGKNIIAQVETPYELNANSITFLQTVSKKENYLQSECEAKINAGTWQYSFLDNKLILKNQDESKELSKLM